MGKLKQSIDYTTAVLAPAVLGCVAIEQNVSSIEEVSNGNPGKALLSGLAALGASKMSYNTFKINKEYLINHLYDHTSRREKHE